MGCGLSENAGGPGGNWGSSLPGMQPGMFPETVTSHSSHREPRASGTWPLPRGSELALAGFLASGSGKLPALLLAPLCSVWEEAAMGEVSGERGKGSPWE